MRPSVLCSVVFALGLAVFSSGSARAFGQDAPSPGGPPPESDAPPVPVDTGSVATLNVKTSLVNVYFSARDKNGFLTNLHKDDCGLLEDKAPQTIKNFTQEKNLPLTIGILLDTSGSQTNVLPLEQESGATFLKDVLTPKDEAFLISFDVNVDLLSDYTNSPREIKRAIDKATINTGAGSGSVTGNGQARGTLLTTRCTWPRTTSCGPRRGARSGAVDRRRRSGLAGDAEDGDRGGAEGQRHRLCDPDRRPRLL